MLGLNSQLQLRATRAETLTAGVLAVDGCWRLGNGERE